MARYENIAADANQIVITLFEDFCSKHPGAISEQANFLEQLLRLYNLGIRTSPRACQAVVRERAVRLAAAKTPVTISMKKVQMKDRYTGSPVVGKYYNALQIHSTALDKESVLDDTADEE